MHDKQRARKSHGSQKEVRALLIDHTEHQSPAWGAWAKSSWTTRPVGLMKTSTHKGQGRQQHAPLPLAHACKAAKKKSKRKNGIGHTPW